MLIRSSRETALLNHATAHTGTVKCIGFSTVQPNLLASAGTKGEFFVWDTSKPSVAPTAYKSNRLDEITSLAWNNKVGHIIALGGKSGALSVWDLKKKSELIHIPTRFSVSSIAWHPTEATILTSASADDHNPVIQGWDLRNANAPKFTLNGHEKGILSLSWCAQDPDLLLSSGSDNRTLIWNPFTSQIVAELPAASQWVHQVSWCRRQPQILANATLDGKISIYSIQDTTTPAPVAVVDDVPAGDDFFDSIPRNFQAQTASFTLKQTPKWLKRPAGARFGFGDRLAQFSSKSLQVELSTHQNSNATVTAAAEMKKALAEQSIKELCDSQRSTANDEEKHEWDIIETLTAEHARDALRKYLGFTKEEIEEEIIQKFSTMEIASPTQSGQEASGKEVEADGNVASADTKTDESSVFGETSADDDFMGIINSQASTAETQSTSTTKPNTSENDSPAFAIFSATSTDSDKLITRAIFTGQFDRAIDVCLKEDRISDAFMLALCGGTESQKRVQKAYFSKTNVPYARLLSSIVAGNLVDVVKNARLEHWKEILAILCNYARPDEFLNLCEILGKRLEQADSPQSAAVVCYLAGERLEHLVRIWSGAQAERERQALLKSDGTSPFDLHSEGLGRMVKKVSIFRKAVSFVDTQPKQEDQYLLSSLYRIYLEYAQLIAAEGDLTLAAEYIAMVPATFEGAEALKKRVSAPVKATAPTVQRTTGMRPTSMRNVYTQPSTNEQSQPSPATRGVSSYPAQVSASTTSAPVVDTQSSATARPAHNPYAPTGMQANQQNGSVPSQTSYQPAATTQASSPYQSTSMNGQYQNPVMTQTQSQYPSFAPPPSRITSNGPTVLPAAQRKDITPWNDAPDIPLPAPRRATPAINRSNITSPFQPAATPTLQSFGPPQPQPLAPPPKTRSPAPPRAPSSSSAPVAPPQVNQATMNAYAPPQQASNSRPDMSTRPSSDAYAPQSTQYATTAPSPYNGASAAPSAPQQQLQQPRQPVNHAPPPTTFAPPPRIASDPPKATAPPRSGPSAGKQSPGVAKTVNLSPEPSRQNSPVQEKFEFPQARYPPGDRTHMPESDRPIEQDLTNLLMHLQRVAPEKFRKPLEETQKRFSGLFDLLNNTQLTDGTREQLRMASAALRNSDWATAWAIHNELTQDKMHECRAWIVGIKTLVVVGKKSVEEHWQ